MGAYDGRSRADLQAQLTALTEVYDAFASGQQVVTVTYSQGGGTRTVTYNKDSTNLGMLDGLISELQQRLGIIRKARRQIRFIYR